MTSLLARLHGIRLHLLREDGQTMAEYGVVLTLVTIALVAAFGLLAGSIEDTIDRARTALDG